MANKKVKITGYAQRTFYDEGIEYRNFSDDLVGLQLTSKGGTPLFTNGNFTITTNTEGKLNKFYNTGKLSDYVTLETIKNDLIVPNFTKNVDLILNSDNTDVSMYALFGSLKEFIRVSLEEVIQEWPASLYITKMDQKNPFITGSTIENYVYDDVDNTSTFNINVDRIQNKYNINYDVKGSLKDTFNEGNNLRDLITSYTKYVIDYNNLNYEVLEFIGSSINSIDELSIKVKGNPFSGATSNFSGSYHIRPNNIVIEEFFKSLSDFKGFILNRLTTPKYTARFTYPVQGDEGNIIYKNDKLTWATTDGYNLDYDTREYIDYATRLFNISENYDSNVSDLMTRELVSESISDFDTTKGANGEIIESESQKMTRTLRIYGRAYDEVNKYIKGISFANVISYDKKNNAPDDLVKNIARVLGWELTNSLLENNLVDNFLTVKDSTFSGHSIGLTKHEAEIELWRRLILNSPWLWKSKGTRKAIEFLLDFIGTPKGLINFNEYVYVVEGSVDIDEVRLVMDELFGTREIDTLSVDSDGYPMIPKNGTLINGVENYFQKGGQWYRKTYGENSNIDILKGNNPHSGPYDRGQEFLEQFTSLIPNFSGVTIGSEEIFTENKNIFINYNNGLISDLSIERVIASGNTNINLEGVFNVTSPLGGCVFDSSWDLDVYIDNILVGSRKIFESGPETTISLPTDVNFMTGATEILNPLEILVYDDMAQNLNGDFIFINDTDSCESSIFLNKPIRLEATYTVNEYSGETTNTYTSGITLFDETFGYVSSAETFNELLTCDNEVLNCYTLVSEIIEDPKPSIEETDCGCEITDCDQSLKFSLNRIYSEIEDPLCEDIFDYKIVLHPEEGNGTIFDVDEGETATLTIGFDYLLNWDCDKLKTCITDYNIANPSSQITLANVLSGATITATVEKHVIGSGLEKVYETPVLSVTDFLSHITGNTGYLVTGNNCDTLNADLLALLGGNCELLPSGNNALNSEWVTFEHKVTDLSVLSGITNELISLGICIHTEICEFNLLIDRIKLTQDSLKIKSNKKVITKSPGFKIKKVIDNKKSWIPLETLDNRDYDLEYRNTSYNVNEGKLVINSKELSIDINIASAIEEGVNSLIYPDSCFVEIGETFTNNTNIYAVYDTTSMSISDATAARDSLESWFVDFKASHPNYTGELYGIPVYSERYVNYATRLQDGTISSILQLTGGWGVFNTLPPTFSGDNDVILLAFVDETNTEYHADRLEMGYNSGIYSLEADNNRLFTITGLPAGVEIDSITSRNYILIVNVTGLTITYNTLQRNELYLRTNASGTIVYVPAFTVNYHFTSNPAITGTRSYDINGNDVTTNLNKTQPNNAFISDYQGFINIYDNFTSFKGIVYPIVKNSSGAALVLQVLSAIEGKILSPIELSEIDTGNLDLSIITQENPYTNHPLPNGGFMKPLKSFNWAGIYNKTSPAANVFNSDVFTNDLNYLLTGGYNLNLIEILGDDYNESLTKKEQIENIRDRFIDVKSRKIISSYPILKLLYERYFNYIDYCGVNSSMLDYKKVIDFSNLLGFQWIDLIEQFVPSTALWKSTNIYSNTIFDSNKFKYRNYSIETCTAPIYNDTRPHTFSDGGVEIFDLSNNFTTVNEKCEVVNNSTLCETIYAYNINDGSIFGGNVTIITIE